MVREHTLQDVNLSQFVEPYFIAQHLFYSMHINKKVYSAVVRERVVYVIAFYFHLCCISFGTSKSALSLTQ